MYRIVAGITSLKQHLDALDSTPDIYRPKACPHCGFGCLWRHGCYLRKADRSLPECKSLNPILIPRFRCCGCRRTCSRLPACIAPRRWYGWAAQQQVLLMLLIGCSLREISNTYPPCRDTCRRWWQWLQARTELFGFHLRSHFAELGRVADENLWQTCMAQMSLMGAMSWLDRNGVIVP